MAWRRGTPAERRTLALMIGLAPFYKSGNDLSGLVAQTGLCSLWPYGFPFGKRVSCWTALPALPEPLELRRTRMTAMLTWLSTAAAKSPDSWKQAG